MPRQFGQGSREKGPRVHRRALCLSAQALLGTPRGRHRRLSGLTLVAAPRRHRRRGLAVRVAGAVAEPPRAGSAPQPGASVAARARGCAGALASVLHALRRGPGLTSGALCLRCVGQPPYSGRAELDGVDRPPHFEPLLLRLQLPLPRRAAGLGPLRLGRSRPRGNGRLRQHRRVQLGLRGRERRRQARESRGRAASGGHAGRSCSDVRIRPRKPGVGRSRRGGL
mmetsp:Transcript_4840/g.18340  ORF Transcript_4840/g.18340 Transcript_4840/m.18340 type:complete len:225 (-) Transcript_4840:1957-2631(-)